MEHAEPATGLLTAEADAATAAPMSPRRLAWRRLRRDRVALASGVFLVFVLFACFPGAKLYGRLIGHGPNDLFPYAVSIAQKPVGPFTRVYAAPQDDNAARPGRRQPARARRAAARSLRRPRLARDRDRSGRPRASRRDGA